MIDKNHQISTIISNLHTKIFLLWMKQYSRLKSMTILCIEYHPKSYHDYCILKILGSVWSVSLPCRAFRVSSFCSPFRLPAYNDRDSDNTHKNGYNHMNNVYLRRLQWHLINNNNSHNNTRIHMYTLPHPLPPRCPPTHSPPPLYLHK